MYTSLTVHKTGVYKRKTSPVTHGLHHIFVLNTFIHYITGIQHGLKKKKTLYCGKKNPHHIQAKHEKLHLQNGCQCMMLTQSAQDKV